MSDNLFQEIDEDLQRQKMEALWKRYGVYVLAGILAIVLATAAYNFWINYKTEVNQKASSELLTILKDNLSDKEKQITSLEEFAKANRDTSQAVMARLRAAAFMLKDGKTDKAVFMYDAISQDMNVEPVFRQLADLLFVQSQMDNGDPTVLRSRLQPLLADSTWRYTAKEYSALLALKAGDKEEAIKLFSELASDEGAPETLPGRANDMLRWINEGSK